jgi:hypothetical protein
MVLVEPAPADVAESLLSAQVTESSEGRSGFSLTFAFGKGAGARRRFQQMFFESPRRVVLVLTHNGRSHVLMDGVVTKHEVASSNDPGQSKLTVTGEDMSRMLDLIDLSWIMKYPATPIEGRVALCLSKYLYLGIVPLIVPSVNVYIELPTERIPNHMGTDLQYVTSLAKSVGYVFYIDPGPLPGASFAYWGPELRVSAPQPRLVVNSDAQSNVESMSFSYDGFSKKMMMLLLRDEKSPLPIPIPIPDVNPLSPPLGKRPPIPLRVEPLRGISHMKIPQVVMVGLAEAARAAQVISGSGSLNVMRYGQPLRARRLVEVAGAGYPHDGLHFVRSVTHSIKPGEYKQNFSLSRNAFEPFSE